MDNYFEIIVFLFFVLSILNSIFKKKTPPKKEDRTIKNVPKSEKQENTPTTRDIFEELFQVKLPKTPDDSGNTKNDDNYDTMTNSYDSNRTLDEYEESLEQKYNNQFEERLQSKNRANEVNYDRDSISSFNKNSFRKKLEVRRVAASSTLDYNAKVSELKSIEQAKLNKLISLKKKLKNPESLGEMFLIAEILSKPLALRTDADKI